MRKHIFIFLLSVTLGFSFVAMADPSPPPVRRTMVIRGPFFICANEGFYLTQQGNSYHLTGPLYVPGPGYGFRLSDISVNEDGIARGAVSFTPPEEEKKQLVTPALNLDTNFTSETQVKRLHISIDKSWSWGDERISCQKAG